MTINERPVFRGMLPEFHLRVFYFMKISNCDFFRATIFRAWEEKVSTTKDVS
jgi:hypothetical protein